MQIQKHAFGESVSLVNIFALKRQIHLTTDRPKFNKPNFSLIKHRIYNRIIEIIYTRADLESYLDKNKREADSGVEGGGK